ncbi:unnamed protein product [Bursaphelenchus okinawaensis]|uniref:Uncharacterized protein n=1 Tax=Bursaphelenchus okinawaensis TaxID=465554 RepID=A0A811KEP5_9BILA|nr:unnamed protein product [Bursaphelenchus okinawaensis]CAG9100648.1 unnamed protein product [Bursaphelenchus okinawaensis]
MRIFLLFIVIALVCTVTARHRHRRNRRSAQRLMDHPHPTHKDYSHAYVKYIIKNYCQYEKLPDQKRLVQVDGIGLPGFGPGESFDPTEEALHEICLLWEETGRQWNPNTMYDD